MPVKFDPSETTDHCLLHKPRARWQQKTYHSILWSDELQTWLVFNPELVKTILLSDDFQVGLSVQAVAEMEDRFRLDLSSLRHATAAMPVAHEGPAHAVIRRDMAQSLQENVEAALIAFSDTFAASISGPLQQQESFDINAAALAPATARLMSVVCGFELSPTGGETAPSQMLDRLLGLRRRKEINARIKGLFQRADAAADDATADRKVAMAILGFDTLHATLSENLLAVLRRAEGIPLNQIDWPNEIEETGAPFIERIARKQTRIGEQEIKEGQAIRLFLDDLGPLGFRSTELFFGKGRHACIGRVISQRAWLAMVQQLNHVSHAVTIESVTERTPDFMFRFPSEIVLKVNDGRHRA